jgi:hypothetical protein
MKLIRNAIRTPDGTILISRFRHNYKEYQDTITGKVYLVDGGLSYCRRSDNGDEVDMCLYDDQPHEIQREVLKWGSYGKDGKQPITYIPVSEMDTAHIEAVIDECEPSEVLLNCFRKELEIRGG